MSMHVRHSVQHSVEWLKILNCIFHFGVVAVVVVVLVAGGGGGILLLFILLLLLIVVTDIKCFW